MIIVNDVTYTIFGREWNHIVDVVMWSKFGNSSISMREVIANSEKSIFWRVLLVQVH